MAKTVWAVFCQSVIIDGSTNNVSIINQLDQLQTAPPPEMPNKKGVPLMAFQCALVCVWERDRPEISETVPIRIRLIGPDKKSLPIGVGTIDLRKNLRSRLITNLPGLPVVGEGRYTFVYEIQLGSRWKRAADVSVLILYQKATRAKKPTQH